MIGKKEKKLPAGVFFCLLQLNEDNLTQNDYASRLENMKQEHQRGADSTTGSER